MTVFHAMRALNDETIVMQNDVLGRQVQDGPDTIFIPLTEAERATVAAYKPAPIVPDSVSGVAARHVLRSTSAPSGTGTMFDHIKAALQQLPEPPRVLALAALEEAPTFRRTGSQLINSLDSAVGLSSETIDALFIAAKAVDDQL